MQAADGRGLRCAPITHYCFSRIEFAASRRLLRFLPIGAGASWRMIGRLGKACQSILPAFHSR
jgi:hypothetical protein